MIRKMEQFRILEGRVEDARKVIEEYVEAIFEHEPETHYDVFQEDGGSTFVHIMSFKNAEAEKQHRSADYTLEFIERIYPLCGEKPSAHDLTLVRSRDSYFKMDF